MKILILLVLLCFIPYIQGLVCWQGSSTTYSTGIQAKNSNICVRYNYCPSSWINGTCTTKSIIYYEQMSILDSNNIVKSKDVIRCGTDYCNELINPRTLCYYGSSLNTYRREFDINSKSCYSYMYYCTSANDYCLTSDIGKYRIAYSISNSTTCEGIKDLVKCCQTDYCTKTIQPSTSLACTMYYSMKILTLLLFLYILT